MSERPEHRHPGRGRRRFSAAIRRVDHDIGPNRRENGGREGRAKIGAPTAADTSKWPTVTIGCANLVVALDDPHVVLGCYRAQSAVDR